MTYVMKALIVAGKAVQDHEFVYPYYRLPEAGFTVDVAVRGRETVYGSIGMKITPDLDFCDVEIEKYQLLVIPGGAKAMEYMRQDEGLLAIIREAHQRGLVISAICHGAQLLISAGLVRDRSISGYYSIRDDINNAGGTYINQPAVVDGKIITSPHYKHLGSWMSETIRAVHRDQDYHI
ncbi:DJ-1/PfpI/YhbO family deglycase/protease [Achromobacter spanius]|uniref:Peptidase n=1 Tax=Achromobacter spanius TaxID=217203 RepID=A0A2S0I5M0_9BURK|nr:DJ-1/PfpI/YhbO family deglycase/protease [Achromobacter spanius]AVJ27346.1 peptidase [Achromobacter spanius]